MDFARDVAPVLEQSCSTPSCHAGTEKLDLRRRSGESPATFAERLYDILMAPSPRSSDPRLGLWVHPGRARTSPLVWHVLGKRTTRPWDGTVTSSIPVSGPRKLEGAVSRALIEWIDLGAHAPITESGEQEGEKP